MTKVKPIPKSVEVPSENKQLSNAHTAALPI